MMGPSPENVVPYRSPRAREEATQLLGMVVFLCGWAMLFCGLFMAYGVIRSTTQPWPPVDEPRLPRGLGLAATALILAASGAYHTGFRRLKNGLGPRAALWFLLALALSSMFIAVQVATCTGLASQGLTLASGAYGSIVLTLIGFHALHSVVGLGGQLLICFKSMRGLYNAARAQPARLWGVYLHAVSGVWCALYVAVYLI